LGFTPIDPDPELVRKITRLYSDIRATGPNGAGESYELQNVFGKRMLDGELYLFDLVNTSGEDDSYTEVQAVAVVSPHLALPAFMLTPRSDMEGVVSMLGNQLLAWVISKFGNPVEFPESPQFERRYLVSSPDPGGVRRFLDEERLHRLAKTRLMGVHAGGDLFTVARIDLSARSLTQEMISERVSQAMDVFSIFLD
jgi:hypothetical protein